MMIDTFRYDDWIYGVLDPNAPPSEFDHFESFVSIWQNKRADRVLPARKDFDFDAFIGWHGWVTIDKVHQNPFDMECTLCGTNITKLNGSDQTGMRLSQYLNVPEERPYYEPYLACHELATQHKLATYGMGGLLHKALIGMEWVGLPCADDGVTISHFISLTRQLPIAHLKSSKIKPLTKLI